MIKFENTEVNVDRFIEHLNKIIFEAIYFGGDAGGPYCSWPEDLEKTLNLFLKEYDLDKDYYVDLKEWEFVIKKQEKDND